MEINDSYKFDNTHLLLENLKLEKKYIHNNYDCLIYGQVDCYVDYNELSYSYFDLTKKLEEALNHYLDTSDVKYLYRLSGRYLIIVALNNKTVKIITSDDYTYCLYYSITDYLIKISDNYYNLIDVKDLLIPENYCIENLNIFKKKRNCKIGQTYLNALKRLVYSTVYNVNNINISIEGKYFDNTTRKYDITEIKDVVGLKLDKKKNYSLAYSAGTDSHFLLNKFKDSIQELATVYYKYPFYSLKKNEEVVNSYLNCMNYKKEYNLISTDFNSIKILNYFEHFVNKNPFINHPAVHFYDLVGKLKTSNLITGQNADAIIFFSETMKTSISRMFLQPRSSRSIFKVLSNKYKIKKTFDITTKYYYNYYYKLNSYLNSGDSLSWVYAADYFNKSIYFPYTEPLVRHISWSSKRSLKEVFDPKWYLRIKDIILVNIKNSKGIEKSASFNTTNFYNEIISEIEKDKSFSIVVNFLKKQFDLNNGNELISLLHIFQFLLNSKK